MNIYTSSAPPAEEGASALLRRVSATLARELGKPESYVMTCLVPKTTMTFAGTGAPACYAEVKNIGEFSADLTLRLSKVLGELLSEGLEVPRDRIYIEFQNARPHLWGFDGETFA